MKSINECFRGARPLGSYTNPVRVDEGLKEIIQSIGAKFKQCVAYLKGVVARIGSYWLPVDENGEPQPAISPLTMGQAYMDGLIKKISTVVVLSKSAAKLVGCKTSKSDCRALYGRGNSLAYWKKMLKESEDGTGKPLCEVMAGPADFYEHTDENGKMVNEVKLQNSDPSAKYNVVDTPALTRRIAIALKNKKLNRLLVLGAPGIGKTAVLEAALKSLPDSEDYNLIVKTLSNETPDNFTLPKYVEIDGETKATDVPKTWLPVYKPTADAAKNEELDAACGKGLLFIDELSRATPQVLNVMLPLINEGAFNGYRLGSGWAIICASNRMEDELSGQAEIGNALSNRFSVLYYEPTCKSWRKWAETQGYISPLLLSWLSMPETESMSGGKYFYWDPNESGEYNDTSKLMCTPRSWTNACRVLCSYMDTAKMEGFSILDVPRDILAIALNECVPSQAVDSFLAFLDVVSRIGNFDQAVCDVWNGGPFKIAKKDLNQIAVPIAQLVVSSHGNALPDADEFKNLAKWVCDQKSDQLASYILDMLQVTFAGVLTGAKESLRPTILILGSKVKALKPAEVDMYKQAYKPLLDKWGVSLEDFPDWSEGYKLLAKTYGDAFNAAKIEGQDALG